MANKQSIQDVDAALDPLALTPLVATGAPRLTPLMSSLYHTQARTDLEHRDYGFILALVCMALALVVASVIFHASIRR
jgi:hypothetical protein